MKAIREVLANLRRADQQFNLINNGDRIAVGVSGGKDSLLLIYALHLYQKFAKTSFTLVPITLDLGFPNFNVEMISEYLATFNQTLIVEDSKTVYPILKAHIKDDGHLPCSICSKMKKAAINKVAKLYQCNKVAFAHHFDDGLETLFLNQIYGGRIATFAPKMHLDRIDVTFIRPFILLDEATIKKAVKELKIPVQPSPCPSDGLTKRADIKQLIANIYQTFPTAKANFSKMMVNYEQIDLWNDQVYYQLENKDLCVHPIRSAFDAYQAMMIRQQVFVIEQAIDPSLEFDGTDDQAVSFLLYLKEQPIGHIRYIKENDVYHIGRVAILKEYRHQGYGLMLMNWLHQHLYQKVNPITFIVHAQAYVKSFYEKLGYIAEPNIFLEAGIEHYLMRLTIV